MESKILINHPCTRNLDRMPRTATGVFCTACSEKVEDLTRFTDEQLVAWLSANAKTKPCGIYTAEQARVPFAQRLAVPFRYAAISLLSLFAFKEAAAQAPVAASIAEQPGTTVLPGDTQQQQITGRVVSRIGKRPLAGVIVSVTGADSLVAVAVTKDDGTYDCALPYTTDTTFTITFSKRGYDIEAVYGYVPCDRELNIAIHKADWKQKRRQRQIKSKF